MAARLCVRHGTHSFVSLILSAVFSIVSFSIVSFTVVSLLMIDSLQHETRQTQVVDGMYHVCIDESGSHQWRMASEIR